jgi:hypothetical protein
MDPWFERIFHDLSIWNILVHAGMIDSDPYGSVSDLSFFHTYIGFIADTGDSTVMSFPG